jgi:predicted N-formylglutamate amidohydrolase
MYRHACRRGLAHALLEIRNDLIETPAGVQEWADRLEPILRDLVADPELHEIRDFVSTDATPTEGADDAAIRPSYAHRA